MRGNTIDSAADQLRGPNLVRGRGRLQLIRPANPAAGTGFTRVIPGDYWERPLSVAFTLANGSVLGPRTIAQNLIDGDGNIFNQTQIAVGVPGNVTISQYGDLSQVAPIQGGVSPSNEGSVTTPAANGTIASLGSLAAGTYFVTAVVNMAGTLAQAVDANNIKLWNGGLTLYENLDNNIGSSPQTFGPFEIEVPASGSILASAINLATTGAIYSVSLSAIPATQQGSYQFPDILLKSGWGLQIAVGGIQAADQLSGIFYLAERYPSGDTYLHGHEALDELAAAVLATMARG